MRIRTAAQNEYEIISILLRTAYQILRTAYHGKPVTARAGEDACASIGFVSGEISPPCEFAAYCLAYPAGAYQ